MVSVRPPGDDIRTDGCPSVPEEREQRGREPLPRLVLSKVRDPSARRRA